MVPWLQGMDVMTEREKFMARLSEARDGGLVDMKFFLCPTGPMKTEEIFAAMNQVQDAVKVAKRHSGWNGDAAA